MTETRDVAYPRFHGVAMPREPLQKTSTSSTCTKYMYRKSDVARHDKMRFLGMGNRSKVDVLVSAPVHVHRPCNVMHAKGTIAIRRNLDLPLTRWLGETERLVRERIALQLCDTELVFRPDRRVPPLEQGESRGATTHVAAAVIISQGPLDRVDGRCSPGGKDCCERELVNYDN